MTAPTMQTPISFTPAQMDAATAVGLFYDSWTDSFRDQYNDVWVSRPFERKLWTAAFRDSGNVSALVGRYRRVEDAIAAAGDVIAARRSVCHAHPYRRGVTNLDGDTLCQDCADQWVRSEGRAHREGLAA